MVKYSDVVFLSSSSRVVDGNTYFNVNLECIEDGDIVQLGADRGVCDNLKKYQHYKAKLKEGRTKNGSWSRVVDMVEIPASAK